MLLQLLPEVLETILAYCSLSDLKELALTNSQYNELLQPWIQHTMSIPRRSAPRTPFPFQYHDDGTVDEVQLRKRFDYVKVLKLRHDSVRYMKIPEIILRVVGTLEQLVELDVAQSGSLDDRSFGLLCGEGFSGLRVLDMSSNSRLSDEGLRSLRNLKSLEELICKNCNITDASLSYIASLKKLRKLDLSNCPKVTDISQLCELKELEKLHLVWCLVTDEGLSCIGKIQSLKTLDLNGCYRLSDTSLMSVSALSSLVGLDISECRGLTDIACEYIGRMLSLEKLSIRFTNITDAGLVLLHSLINLKEFFVGPLMGTTVDGLTCLVNRVPNVYVTRTQTLSDDML